MKQAHFSLLPTDRPGMVLLTRQIEENKGIALHIGAVDHRLRTLLEETRRPNPLGAPLLEVFDRDRQVFDELIDFVLRCREMPYLNSYTMEDETTITCQMLQYLNLFREWRIVTIVYFKGKDHVIVTFGRVEDFESPAVLWHLLLLLLRSRMSVHVNNTGYWTIDCPGQRIFLSRKMAETLGLGSCSIVVPMRRYLQTVHPDDLDAVVSALDNIRDISAGMANRNIRADGSTLHLYSYATPFYDGEGRMVRIMGISENVSEKMDSRERLAASEKRFSAIVETSRDLLLIVDDRGVYTHISQGTAGILGVEPSELIGRKVGGCLLRTEDRKRVVETVEELRRTGASGKLECRIRVAAGGYRWYSFTIFTILNVADQATETVGIGHDITREKYSENKMLYLSSHDSLTKTHNRAFFWKSLEQLYKESKRDFCLVLLDVNGLRLVNDVFGQMKGDRVLSDVAVAVKKAFRRARIIARIGGDEFAVIAYTADKGRVEANCAEIDAFCDGTKDRMLPISISWGIACRSEGGSGIQELFRIAEGRMYNNKLLKSASMHSQVISSLKEALRSRNLEASDHMERMERMVTMLGKRLGLPPNELDKLVLLAALHDVGKVAIPDHIINKPGPLSEEEWAIMRGHCEIGSRIAMTSKELAGIAQEILHHHERWDGEGYPGGKREGEIPLLSQLIAVVDTYDVMTHARPYKEPASHEEALAELKRCAGTQFSPAIVELFLDIFREFSSEEASAFTQAPARGSRGATGQ